VSPHAHVANPLSPVALDDFSAGPLARRAGDQYRIDVELLCFPHSQRKQFRAEPFAPHCRLDFETQVRSDRRLAADRLPAEVYAAEITVVVNEPELYFLETLRIRTPGEVLGRCRLLVERVGRPLPKIVPQGVV